MFEPVRTCHKQSNTKLVDISFRAISKNAVAYQASPAMPIVACLADISSSADGEAVCRHSRGDRVGLSDQSDNRTKHTKGCGAAVRQNSRSDSLGPNSCNRLLKSKISIPGFAQKT